MEYIGWQYLSDLNDLNKVLTMTHQELEEIGLDGKKTMSDLVSVTWDTNHGEYVAFWKCRNDLEE